MSEGAVPGRSGSGGGGAEVGAVGGITGLVRSGRIITLRALFEAEPLRDDVELVGDGMRLTVCRL